MEKDNNNNNDTIIIAPNKGKEKIDLSKLYNIKDLKKTLESAKAHPDVSDEAVKKIESRINVLATQNKTSLESAKLVVGADGQSYGAIAEYIDVEDCQGV